MYLPYEPTRAFCTVLSIPGMPVALCPVSLRMSIPGMPLALCPVSLRLDLPQCPSCSTLEPCLGLELAFGAAGPEQELRPLHKH